MKRPLFSLLVVFALAAPVGVPVTEGASTDFILKGRILDTGAKPVEGGEVFVYDSVLTRRPADFISPKTDGQGLYRIVIPTGKYWVVARVRSGARYGPLMSGGKHSGEAVEVEATPGGELLLDFTVADVREMARDQHKTGEGYRKVGGRIVDRDGRPVRGAYAFARREHNGAWLPDYISPVDDEDGRYTLFLPSGRYCLGGSTTYPPEDGAPCQKLFLDADSVNDIRLNYGSGNEQDKNLSGTNLDSHE